MKTIRLCAAVAVFSFGFFSRGAEPAKAPAIDQELRVGVIVPLTGQSQSYGKAVLEGTQAFFRKYNSQASAGARKIMVESCDDAYDPKKTTDCFKQLVEDKKVFALLNVFGGPTTAAILPAIQAGGVPSLGNMTPATFMPPLKDVFITRPGAVDEMDTLVDLLAKERNAKSFGLLYQDDVFGQNYLNFAQKALAKHGLTLKAKAPVQRNSSDVDAAAKTLAAAAPDVVILGALMPATAAFVKRFQELGGKSLMVGNGGTSIPAFAAETANVDLTYYGTSYSPPLQDASFETVQAYKADMKAAGYADLEQYGVEAYTNSMIFAEALKRCGAECTRAQLEKSLESLHEASFGGMKISFSEKDHRGLRVPYLVKKSGRSYLPVHSLKD